jgi:hypothetical protein
MSRTYIYQILKQDANSTATGTLGYIGLSPANVYTAGVDSPKGDVFVTVRFDESSPGFGGSNRTNIRVWAYDRDRDFLRIERMLKRIRTLLESVEATKTTEGWITTIKWTGDSPDLHDDIYRASARNSEFTLVDSGR